MSGEVVTVAAPAWTLIDVLSRVAAAGGKFVIGTDQGLVYRGPKDAITADLRAAIAAHRPALIAVASAADHDKPMPANPDGLRGDDWREAEAAISAARGCGKDARWVAETVTDEGRRRALLAYLGRVS